MDPPAPHPPPYDLRRFLPTSSPVVAMVRLRAVARSTLPMWDAHVLHVRAAWRDHARSLGDLALPTGPDRPCTMGEPRGPDVGRAVLGPTRQGPDAFDTARELANLLANAEAEDIAVTWFEHEVTLGGFVYRPKHRQARRRDRRAAPLGLDARSLPAVTVGEHVIVLNPAQGFTTTFEVLLHEVAHVLSGHLGPREPVGRGTPRVPSRRPPQVRAREVEAHLATVLAARRRGHAPSASERQFLHHFDAARAADQLGEADLSWVIPVADVLAAWCTAPPDGDAVRAVGDAPRPGSLVAVSG